MRKMAFPQVPEAPAISHTSFLLQQRVPVGGRDVTKGLQHLQHSQRTLGSAGEMGTRALQCG